MLYAANLGHSTSLTARSVRMRWLQLRTTFSQAKSADTGKIGDSCRDSPTLMPRLGSSPFVSV
jgi:hypothetical protein